MLRRGSQSFPLVMFLPPGLAWRVRRRSPDGGALAATNSRQEADETCTVLDRGTWKAC